MVMRDDWTALEKLIFLRGSGVVGGAAYDTISGNPVSFTAKAAPLRQLSVAFSPVQDLNGYDSPWPAGGGKNKIPYPYWTDDGVIGGITWVTQSDGKITGQGTTTMGTNFFTAYDVGLKAGTYTLSVKGKHVGMLLLAYDNEAQKLLALINPSSADASATFTIESDVTALRVYFNQGQAGQTVDISAYVQLEAGSSATSYAPYSNECPILGWDSLNVEQRGANLIDIGGRTEGTLGDGTLRDFDFSKYYVGFSRTNIYAPDNVESYSISGSSINVTNTSIGGYGVGFPVKCMPNTAYTLRFSAVATPYPFCSAVYYTEDGEYITNQYSSSTSALNFTTPANCHIVMILFAPNALNTNMTFSDIRLGFGSEDIPYVPYNPSSRSISITLGSTVYSGYVDVVTGVGEVTMASVDAGSLSWGLGSASTHTIFAGISGIKLRSNLLSDKYKFLGSYQGSSAVTAMGIYSFTGYAGIGIRDDKFDVSTQAGIDAFAESLDGSVVVYELATPIPIQLTPQEVESLAGDNTMWSTANEDMTITYRSN